GQLPAHLQDVRPVVQAHAEDLRRARHERGEVGGGEVVAGPVRGVRPRPPRGVGEQRPHVGRVDLDGHLAVDAGGAGAVRGAQGREPHAGAPSAWTPSTWTPSTWTPSTWTPSTW